MNFLIVTHVLHSIEQKQYYAYAPYVREMNIWLKYADKCTIVAPVTDKELTAIDIAYKHPAIVFQKVPLIGLTSLKNSLKTIIRIPLVMYAIAKAMHQADHIHLRCPGNIGLLACLVQIFFPLKIKTAKYAGNWDSKSKQPWSYRLQKWILNNTFLTQNIQVLVYGDWEKQSKNIKAFFTATYKEEEKEVVTKADFKSVIEFIFVGSVVAGKKPMYAIQLVEQFIKEGKKAVLNIYGDGIEKAVLEKYIKENQLVNHIVLHGNQNHEVLKKAYQKSHFVVLASKSEGWPKAVAEGMFWGCVPLATSVSCVPDMLDNGNRGILLAMNLDKDTAAIIELVNDSIEFKKKSLAASNWSQNYTLDRFENEIQKLLQCE